MSAYKLNNGGQAFPTQSEHDRNGNILQHCDSGMTLRDYFAAHALQGLLAYSLVNPAHGNYHENCTVEGAAGAAYAYADAMLAERSKPE